MVGIPLRHLAFQPPRQTRGGGPEEFDFSMESFGFDESKEVAVEVKAGAVVFFNGYLLHRSRKNRSDVYRRVLVNHYMNAYSKLPWGATTARGGTGKVSIAAADDRCVGPVAGVDPYDWAGYDNPKQNVYLRTCKANTPAKASAPAPAAVAAAAPSK